MAAGLPVIASNFPHWRKIIDETKCGITVDPTKPKEIAEAIDTLLENPEMAAKMGQNGSKAAQTTYNWSAENQKLLALYQNLLTS